uniref:Rho-GAP domain-containing protein n=3 Tax=Lygus hesperus TaxID=30085 RepID=A0A0K8SMC5_LYGHE
MGARGSFSSLIEAPLTDDKGSIESLMSPTLSMPGLDDISLEGGSESNLALPPSSGVPNLVSACLNHLQSHLNTLGIFRVSSSKKRVRQLREEFDLGKELRLEDEQCPHDVATLLKEYFRDLPDPLLCKDLYHAFIQTQRIRNRRLQHEAMQHLLQLLPLANRDTLLSLLTFLSLVASHCDDHKDPDSGEWVSGNRMDSTNLATLFAPNILHAATPNRGKDELSQERMDERSDAINVIRSLIDNFQSLYMVSAELLDEVYVHMMDTHPDALDQLLRRKEATAIERTDRGRERLSKKRRDEIAKKRNESRERRAESGSGDSRRPSDERTFSSSDSGRLSPQTIQSEGVITASLKIPVPHVTSLLQNLDDIPFIEDGDRHHITLGMVKGHQGPDSNTSESGLGSTSPVVISPVTSPPPEAWESGSSTTTESPTRRYQTQRYTRLEGSSHSYSRLQTERLTKSASSTAVVSHISPIPTSISSIGSDVLRSKTADIERMIRSSASSATSSSKGSSWSSSQRAVPGASAESKRRLTESATRALTDAPATRPVGVWKRRELIASQPKSPL